MMVEYSKKSVLPAFLALLLVACGSKSTKQDYWMYAGTYTTHGGKGIYLYKFHAATGKLDAAGLAAGWLWQSNIDALASSPSRIWAQIRAEWPNVKLMVKGVQDPAFHILHPNGRYLYTANSRDLGTVSAFQVDPANGKLTILNTEPSSGGLPVFVAVDNSGKNLLVANYSGTVAVLPIDSTGHLHHATSVIRQQGEGPGQALEPHAHSIVLSPDNRFAISTDTGLDEIFVYKFDADKGSLTLNEPPFVKTPPGTGPRQFVFHPNGNLAYAIGESGSCVISMRWDAQRGVLALIRTISTLPLDFHGESAGADVLIHPGGRFLYASNRGHDSIAVFTVDPIEGTLTTVEYASSYGERPSNLRIDPTGNYLFAANVFSSSIEQFRIDQQTGRLTPIRSFGIPFPMVMSFTPVR
jgi:6-phosphogluconolactonase